MLARHRPADVDGDAGQGGKLGVGEKLTDAAPGRLVQEQAVSTLGGVVIGLAVDETIYFLSRVSEGLMQGMRVGDAASRATLITGRAMIKTSLILTGGFLTMAASDFMPSVYFGIFFAFSILVALLADLVVLPVLLRLAWPLLDRKHPSVQGAPAAPNP